MFIACACALWHTHKIPAKYAVAHYTSIGWKVSTTKTPVLQLSSMWNGWMLAVLGTLGVWIKKRKISLHEQWDDLHTSPAMVPTVAMGPPVNLLPNTNILRAAHRKLANEKAPG